MLHHFFRHIGKTPDEVTTQDITRSPAADGPVAEGFTWPDPSDTRNPVELLTGEGVTFVDGRADPEKRIDAQQLRQRMWREHGLTHDGSLRDARRLVDTARAEAFGFMGDAPRARAVIAPHVFPEDPNQLGNDPDIPA